MLAANLDKDAVVVKFESEIDASGQYQYAYETSNGIAAQENGVGGEQASGSYSYVSPEGENIQVSYTADANGFQPNNLPVPPPIPEAILKALEYIAANPPAPERKK